MNKIVAQGLTGATVLSILNSVSLYSQNGKKALYTGKCAAWHGGDRSELTMGKDMEEAHDFPPSEISDAEPSGTIANGKNQDARLKGADFK